LERTLLHEMSHLFWSAGHDADIRSDPSRNRIVNQITRTGMIKAGFCNDIPALNVSTDIRQSRLRQRHTQISHWHPVLASRSDAAQQDDIGLHRLPPIC
jgi:hypothetical protein